MNPDEALDSSLVQDDTMVAALASQIYMAQQRQTLTQPYVVAETQVICTVAAWAMDISTDSNCNWATDPDMVLVNS